MKANISSREIETEILTLKKNVLLYLFIHFSVRLQSSFELLFSLFSEQQTANKSEIIIKTLKLYVI